jgi:2-methylcitrate dehydratase PrpD
MTQANGEPTGTLIAAVNAMALERIPEDVIVRTKALILDHLGVSLYGASLEWCGIVRETIGFEGGRCESSVYGGGLTTARNAALINGTAGHAIELDDAHDESLSHPGCVVIPAALAVAEVEGSSGAEFLAAVVAGYEAQGRIGASLGSALIKQGYHPTAQIGVFGAAAAAAKLLKLPEREFTWAFGLAGSMASGIMKFTQDPEGTMVKRLHAGMPAERGVLAATLAGAGFTGPRAIIEGDYGYAKIFTGVTDLSRMTRGLGESFEISSISVKLYACCRMFHALIEAIAACRADPAFAIDQIEEIRTFGPANMIDGHLERRPSSPMSAQYSLPHSTAVAILADASEPASFDTATMSRPDILAMADKVTAAVDPELEALYPRKYAGRVEFAFRNGKTIEKTVLDSRSTPANPVSSTVIEQKFLSVTSALLSSSRQSQIIDAVTSLHRASDVSKLAALVRR